MNKNSKTIDAASEFTDSIMDKIGDRIGKAVEEQVGKMIEKKMAVAVMPEGSDDVVLNRQMTGRNSYSLPAGFASDQLQMEIQKREEDAYYNGMKAGMMIGAVAVGFFLVKSLFR